jgi:hypothetical protein
MRAELALRVVIASWSACPTIDDAKAGRSYGTVYMPIGGIDA